MLPYVISITEILSAEFTEKTEFVSMVPTLIIVVNEIPDLGRGVSNSIQQSKYYYPLITANIYAVFYSIFKDRASSNNEADSLGR